MTKYVTLVALVVALLNVRTWAIDEECDFHQKLEPGITYYVYNSEYPESYTGARSCRWFAESPTNVNLTCQTFSLPPIANCAGDRLSVSPSGDLQLADARNFCGTGTFNITSTGHNMNIVFTSFANTTRGRFLCRLEATANTVQSCDCGWKKQTRIVGGTATGVNEYPMMAGLVDADRKLLYCGATIISTKHVLTAAHCRPDTTPINHLGVLVGDHDISTGTDTAAASFHLVSTFVSHPSYYRGSKTNDIAVVTVTDTITFTPEVGPACLPFRHASSSLVRAKVEALGWGTLEFGGQKSDILQKVQLNVEPLFECSKWYPELTKKQLCTWAPGKDACQFDSGGPILWQNPGTLRLMLAGVISYGRTCADDYPGVNTRIGAYLNWILSVTPDANYCRLE